MKNYAPEYFKSLHPLQDYYANGHSNPKQNAQIKRYLKFYSEYDPQKISL